MLCCTGTATWALCAGSGKTLAFLLPALACCMRHQAEPGPLAVVLEPTKELQLQTFNVAARLAAGLPVRPTLLTKAAAAGSELGKVGRALLKCLQMPCRAWLSGAPADVFWRYRTPGSSCTTLCSAQGRLASHRLWHNQAAVQARLVISTPLRIVRAIKRKRMDPAHLRMLILDEADSLLAGKFLAHADKLLGSLDRSRAVSKYHIHVHAPRLLCQHPCADQLRSCAAEGHSLLMPAAQISCRGCAASQPAVCAAAVLCSEGLPMVLWCIPAG